MICPACKNDTIVVERERIELDYCPNCGGVWFDSGEMELLLAGLGMVACSAFVADILKNAESRPGEAVRKCPVCRKKMQKSRLGEKPKVLIDACRRGDGLWFDGGELDEVLKQFASAPSSSRDCDARVNAFLGETLKAKKPAGS